MIELTSHTHFQRVRTLPFCYLCGEPISSDQASNRDHVPPRALFATCDRSPALVLPTHCKCNEDQSQDDEVIGQFVAVLHRKYAKRKRLRFDLGVTTLPGSDVRTMILHGLDLGRTVFRWIRAFHAALYTEFLPPLPETKFVLHPPVQHVVFEEDIPVFQAEPSQRAVFAQKVRKNRIAGALDQIVSNSEKCRYECTWARSKREEPICIFALQLYEWERLGDINNFPRQSCVGVYSPPDGRPRHAAQESALDFPVPSRNEFDAFEQ
jgi:hypothetical protein